MDEFIAEAAAAAEKAAETEPVEFIDAAMASPEERRRLLQRLEARKQVRVAATEELEQRVYSPREHRFAEDLAKLFYAARWMVQGIGFPNGRPLQEQVPVKSEITLLFVEALRQLQMAGPSDPKPKTPEGEAPAGEIPWPTAERP